MPKIMRNEGREQQLFEELRNRPQLGGAHLTDSIYCNVKAWARRKYGDLDAAVPRFDDSTLLRFLMGHGMAGVLEEGRVNQVTTISPDSDSVGTIDIWLRDHPVEIKVTYASINKDIGEAEHWLLQLGGYAARAINPTKAKPWGELWAIHLLGDHGRKFCLEHGAPPIPEGGMKDRPKAVHPDSGNKRLICPECEEFLVEGDRDTALRCTDVEWTWEELHSLHRILTARDLRINELVNDDHYRIGNPPPPEHGYDFECGKCPLKEPIGCPGRQPIIDLEDALEGSILELTERKVATT